MNSTSYLADKANPKLLTYEKVLPQILDIVMGTIQNPSAINKLEYVKKIGVYNEMVLDSVVKGALDERYYSVMDMDFSVVYPDGTIENNDVTDFINNEIIDNTGFQEWVKNIMTFLQFGASYCQPIINPDTYLIDDIVKYPAEKIKWDKDFNIRLKTKQNYNGIELDKNMLIITRTGAFPYGESVLLPAYWIWYFKKEMLKNYSIYGAEAAAGMTLFYMKDNVDISFGDENKFDDAQLERDLKRLTGTQKAFIPPYIDRGETLSGATSGIGSFYNEFLKYADEAITKTIAGQTAGSSDAKGGLGGQQVGQVMTKRQIAIADSKFIEGALQQLIDIVLPFHFTLPVENYPKIKLIPREVYDKEQKLKEFETLSAKGLAISEKQAREVFGWEQPESEDDTITTTTTQTPTENPFTQFSETSAGQIVRLADYDSKDSFLKYLDRKAKKTDKFVNETLMQKTVDDRIRIYKKVYDYYLNTANDIIGNADGVIKGKKLDKLRDITLPDSILKQLQSFYATSLVAYFYAGYDFMTKQAAQAVEQVTRLADPIYQTDVFDVIDDTDLINFDNAIDILAESIPRVPIDKIRDRLAAGALNKALIIGTDETGFLNNFWGKQLGDALDKGLTFQEFKGQLESVLINSGITEIKPYHIETVFRTNMNAAFNGGHYSAIENDPIVKQSFPLARYSAVGDDRTRPDHLAMDGVIMEVGGAEYNTWFPPNGYNCRCIFEYITRYEAREYGVEPTNINDITVERKGQNVTPQPDKGFVGIPEMARL